MRFNSDGKFKIMQITDIQEIPDVSPDTIKLINAALEEEKPDLVVLTGDQIKGYGVSYKGKGDALIESVAETVGKLLKPVTDRHIPFAVTFGNHDRQVGISNKDQFEKIYKASPGCVGEQAEGIDGGGTYNIPILSSDGERTAFNLYLFDSGTDAKGGGYEPFDPQIIDWYRKKRDELKAQNGDYIPSLVFQHIPMFEHYNVLKRVGKREKGAIPAFRIHKGEHYKIDETKCVEGSVLLEPPSIPDINTGEFEALSEKGDVLGVARLAGIMGAKKNAELIPLCHIVPLTNCEVTFTTDENTNSITAVCTTSCVGKTGVEMEALTGVSTVLLTIYDMCKAMDRGMVIRDIHILEKDGGKSGHYIYQKEEK